MKRVALLSGLVFSVIILVIILSQIKLFKSGSSPPIVHAQLDNDWLTVAHDLQRTGHAPTEVRPPFTELWNKTWEGEMFATRVEAIVAGNKVFVGSYSGNMHALDTTTGTELWTFTTDNQAGIAHSPAVSGNILVFGDVGGNIYGLNVNDGSLLWKYTAHGPGGFLTSPAIANNTIYMGSQDGYFYAVNLTDGSLKWEYQVGEMILQTAAIDDQDIIYFGAEDMHAYALEDMDTYARLKWQSQKFYGVSLRDYYPVIASNAIIFRTQPATRFKNEDLTPDGQFLEAFIGTPEEEQDAIVARLNDNPQRKTFYTLNLNDGLEKFVAPVLYGPAGNGGVTSPPTVMGDGRVVTYYRADQSVWEGNGGTPTHGNIAVGILDLSTGRISQIVHSGGDSFSTGWWCIGDEESTLSSGGNVVYNTHQGLPSGIDINTNNIFPMLGVRDTWGGYIRPVWAANEWHGVARGSIAISNNRYYWMVGSRLITIQGN